MGETDSNMRWVRFCLMPLSPLMQMLRVEGYQKNLNSTCTNFDELHPLRIPSMRRWSKPIEMLYKRRPTEHKNVRKFILEMFQSMCGRLRACPRSRKCLQSLAVLSDRLYLVQCHCLQVCDPRKDSTVQSEEGLASAKAVVLGVQVECRVPGETAAVHFRAVQLEVVEVEVAVQVVDRSFAAHNRMVGRMLVVQGLANPAAEAVEEATESMSCVEGCDHHLDFDRLAPESARIRRWGQQVKSFVDGVAIEVVESDDPLQVLAKPHQPGSRVRACRNPYPRPLASAVAPVSKSW